jgi:hypothetical protein
VRSRLENSSGAVIVKRSQWSLSAALGKKMVLMSAMSTASIKTQIVNIEQRLC